MDNYAEIAAEAAQAYDTAINAGVGGMVFNPNFNNAYRMVQHISDKHVGEIAALSFDFRVLTYINYETGMSVDQPVPYLLISFKG